MKTGALGPACRRRIVQCRMVTIVGNPSLTGDSTRGWRAICGTVQRARPKVTATVVWEWTNPNAFGVFWCCCFVVERERRYARWPVFRLGRRTVVAGAAVQQAVCGKSCKGRPKTGPEAGPKRRQSASQVRHCDRTGVGLQTFKSDITVLLYRNLLPSSSSQLPTDRGRVPSIAAARGRGSIQAQPARGLLSVYSTTP